MELDEHLRELAERVGEELDKWFPPDTRPEILARASRHLLEAGGKRLRPCLTLLSCEAVGGKVEDAIEAAAALELLHTFTLIHDDIMDRDEFRRNVKTVHTIWGEPIAIIAGDALFAKVFEALAANARRLGLTADRTLDLFETVSRASFEICQGQALDMLFEGKRDVGEAEYLAMVNGKTGALMEASAKVGGLLGGGGPEQIRALADYGRLVGIAFQIRDDILGLTGNRDKFGKPIGSDIREGKRTLVVVRALEVAGPSDREKLFLALGNERATTAEIAAAIEVIKRTGAIEYAEKKAEEFVASAKSKLKILPNSKAKELLLELADFAAKREF
jgi:geranylgeranyl diphosphate synthase type I